jgi:hypothetical protein
MSRLSSVSGFDCEFLELFEHVDHVLGQPARGNVQAPGRPSALQISGTKMVSSDARSRRRLNRCGAGSVLRSAATTDAGRGKEEAGERAAAMDLSS